MKRTTVGAAIVVGLLALAMLTVGGVLADDATDDAEEMNDSFGAEMSSFAQASATEAEGEVDDGVFAAAMNRTDDADERRALIEQRQERLEQRHERLANERSTLESVGAADGSVKDRATAARVEVGAVGLERSINGTERAAVNAGLDTERLDELRMNARELRGPEVAALAHSIARPAGDRGPPDGVPGAGGNESDDRGPPTDAETEPTESDAEHVDDSIERDDDEQNDTAERPGNGSGPPANDSDDGDSSDIDDT